MSGAIIVVDDEIDPALFDEADVVTFGDFSENCYSGRHPGQRVVNLCDTDRYLSRGYYCSLLAEARGLKVIPTVSTINDLRDGNASWLDRVSWNFPPTAQQKPSAHESEEYLVYFGWTEQPEWQKLAAQVFEYLPAPLLRLTVSRHEINLKLQIQRLAFVDLDSRQRQLCLDRLQDFSTGPWRRRRTDKIYRWEMAILVDPEEADPPSDKVAINRFIKAAARLGIQARKITATDAEQIRFYDALFIRTNTAIDHYTYRLAREAEQQGLVVIDDPQSILRCCNKAYLHDAFDAAQVPQLETRLVRACDEAEIDALEGALGYPLVLKLPEGSCSRGVYKVSDRGELAQRLRALMDETAIVIAQEFCYTSFDWRIGVLAGRAIYACRYEMAKGHWQIYDYSGKEMAYGKTITLPTFEAPPAVIDAAIRATRAIGNGLYGVDIKQMGERVAVIEVNDCPSIERGIEDTWLGKELYTLVMSEFASRLEIRGRS